MEGIENELDWHGKPLGDKSVPLVAGLRKLVQEETLVRPSIPKVTAVVPQYDRTTKITLSSPPNYDGKKEIATRLAHGTALEKLGKNCPYVVALDGDTKNSTFSIKFRVNFLFSNLLETFRNRFHLYLCCLGFNSKSIR